MSGESNCTFGGDQDDSTPFEPDTRKQSQIPVQPLWCKVQVGSMSYVFVFCVHVCKLQPNFISNLYFQS